MKWVIKGVIATIAAVLVYVFLSVVIGMVFSNMLISQTIAVLGAILTFFVILFGKKRRGGHDDALEAAERHRDMMDIRNS